MSNLWNRYNGWPFRKQFSPERWAEIRAKGRGQYVLHQAFSFAVFMIAFHDIFTKVFEHDNAFHFGFYIIQYGFTGICCGYGMWDDREGKYRKAQLNSHLQKPFDDRILPH
jgi:hypothetical protein